MPEDKRDGDETTAKRREMAAKRHKTTWRKKMQNCHKQTQNSHITEKKQPRDANWFKNEIQNKHRETQMTTDSKQQQNSHTQPFNHFWTRPSLLRARGGPKYTPERNPVRISKMNLLDSYLVTGRHDKWRNQTKRHLHTRSNQGQ